MILHTLSGPAGFDGRCWDELPTSSTIARVAQPTKVDMNNTMQYTDFKITLAQCIHAQQPINESGDSFVPNGKHVMSLR